MATVSIHFEARHPSGSFAAVYRPTLEELETYLSAERTRIENKRFVECQNNKQYWLNHMDALTLHKVTTITEDL